MNLLNRIHLDEDFSSVDAGLTPDPFTSVTVAGSNTVSADTVGVGGAQAMKIDYGGGALNAYGIYTFGTSIDCRQGLIRAGVQMKIDDPALAAGNNLGLFVVRSGANDLIRVLWLVDTDVNKGTLRLSTLFGTPGDVDDTELINRLTFFEFELQFTDFGEVELFLNGTKKLSYAAGASPGNFNILRVGSSVGSATPGASGLMVYQRVSVSQRIPYPSEVIGGVGSMRKDRMNAIVLGGGYGGVF